jgi:AraC-like DNA-binding protein
MAELIILMDYFTISAIMIPDQKKKEGFEGQKAIVIPRGILAARCEKNSLIRMLHLTDIGYYPKARFHYRKRPDGAGQHILVYCHNGEGTVSVAGQEYRVSPGNFFIIPRKTPHYYFADAANPWTIYWIHFSGVSSEHIVAHLLQKLGGYTGNLKHFAKTTGIFDEIYAQLEKGYGTDNLIYANMCLPYFLTTILFNENYRDQVDLESKTMVDESIGFFRENLNRMLTLKEMASSVGLSVSHFTFLFRKKTGFPPLEYFNHLKIQQACQYLLFTEMKIKDIAQALGLNDPYYFSRSFARTMGISPKFYRASRTHQP